jgi:hypothetical protein
VTRRPLHFATGWQAAYALGALCWALFFFGLAAAALVSGHESPARQEGPNLATPDWLFLLVFGALVLFTLGCAGLYAWRVFGKVPALIVGDDAIHLHRSFLWRPRTIPIDDVTALQFARVDKIVNPNGRANRQGRCRTALQIDYMRNGQEKSFRLLDHTLAGGVRQLGRIAVLIERACAAHHRLPEPRARNNVRRFAVTRACR